MTSKMGTRRKSSRPRRSPPKTETRPRRWLHQLRQDRDETLKFRDETETRPRRDVCSSWDVIETLK